MVKIQAALRGKNARKEAAQKKKSQAFGKKEAADPNLSSARRRGNFARQNEQAHAI